MRANLFICYFFLTVRAIVYVFFLSMFTVLLWHGVAILRHSVLYTPTVKPADTHVVARGGSGGGGGG